MLFADRLSFDTPRKTAAGYLVTRARAARAGIYDYLGSEVDPEGNTFAADQVVKVYRPESEVFARDSVSSFLMKPVTNDHPSEPVTAENWRDYAKGAIGNALRDGEYLAFDIVLMDAGIIADVESGKRELSNGYQSNIDFKPGETETGEKYDAVMTQIRGNHLAVVDKGRAGPMCRIGDAVSVAAVPAEELIKILTDERTYSGDGDGNTNGSTNVVRQSGDIRMHTLIIDGLQVTEVSDQAKAAIEKLQGQVEAADKRAGAAETKVGELAATLSTKDGEIAALEQKVKDAEVSPAQLEQMVADRSALIAQAKGIDPNVVTDGKTEAEIRKAVVSVKLGDAAKDFDDKAIAGAFAVLAKDVKIDPIRNAMSGAAPQNVDDGRSDYDKAMAERRKTLSDGWKQPAANEAA